MGNWKEKEFEEQLGPVIDDIYNEVFGDIKTIKRSKMDSNDERQLYLDMEMGIDSEIIFNDGSNLTIQEKSRTYANLGYQDFTFEYYNDRWAGIKGEWFKLAAQLYFYGFASNGDKDYNHFYILNVANLRLELKKRLTLKQMEGMFLKENSNGAKANFFAIPFEIINELPGVVYYKSDGLYYKNKNK